MKGKENHGDIGEQWFINQMDGDRGSKTKTSNLQDGAPVYVMWMLVEKKNMNTIVLISTIKKYIYIIQCEAPQL